MVRFQPILPVSFKVWAIVDQYLFRHMASLVAPFTNMV